MEATQTNTAHIRTEPFTKVHYLNNTSPEPGSGSFALNSVALFKRIRALKTIIKPNPIVPILTNILFRVDGSTVIMVASDLQNTIIASVPVTRGQDEDRSVPVSFAIDAAQLTKLLGGIPEQSIAIGFDGRSKVVLTTLESGSYTFFAERAGDFPKLPEMASVPVTSVDGRTLVAGLSKTVLFTSEDDLRPAMTGVYLNGGTLVSTDGHRLITVDVDGLNVRTETKLSSNPSESTPGAILPRKGVNAFLKTYGKSDEAVSLEMSDTYARISWDGYQIMLRLVSERYPDYVNAIPTQVAVTAVVNRMGLLRSLGRVDGFANKVSHQIQVVVNDRQMKISAEDLDNATRASDSLNATVEGRTEDWSLAQGERIKIGFNVRLLTGVLKSLGSTHVEFRFTASNKACIVHPNNGETDTKHMALVMPVMLNNYNF